MNQYLDQIKADEQIIQEAKTRIKENYRRLETSKTGFELWDEIEHKQTKERYIIKRFNGTYFLASRILEDGKISKFTEAISPKKYKVIRKASTKENSVKLLDGDL